eukprot:CAMPEP_0194443780 /NCGR_PEP_ID=MMETSP0176-20130528/126899_1 /TAXON_ID=216777 /ORGANISM="Proboscia alata, Strain PI-D3" /LENGTH=775 /DNA_ID=CAMNT_0039270075 /DNA_START=814 /DNA_END=3141 /DNA_ORIENTATION=-
MVVGIQGASCELVTHAASSNSASHSLFLLPPIDDSGGTRARLVYPSHGMVSIATPLEPQHAISTSSGGTATIWSCGTTIRSSVGYGSITCLTSLSSDGDVIFVGYSSGTLLTFTSTFDGEWVEELVGVVEKSITDVSAIPCSKGMLVCVATSTGVSTFQKLLDENGAWMSMDCSRLRTSCGTVLLLRHGGDVVLCVGSALPRHNTIRLFIFADGDNDDGGGGDGGGEAKWMDQGALVGHLDWISCLDFASWGTLESGGTEGMLASGSQDHRIRLWRFHTSVISSSNDTTAPDVNADTTGVFEDGEEGDDFLLEAGNVARLVLRHKTTTSAITLEALLMGHDDTVSSVAFHPHYPAVQQLLSSSMDRSVFIWEPEEYNEGEGGGVWTPTVRLGNDAGGILGASIGSYLLGYVDAVWDVGGDGRVGVIGHGYGGSLQPFTFERNNNGGGGGWRAGVCLTGHFRGVSDLCWEPRSGTYLLSVGKDQTCRLWAPIPVTSTPTTHTSPSNEPSPRRIWHEVGRPQVHGYDINTVECVGHHAGPGEHKFVSGSDEKQIRVYDAPNATLRLLHTLTQNSGLPIQDEPAEDPSRIERAFLPSLGLSNKSAADEDLAQVSDLNSNALPLERELGVSTLWPETRKLYGHDTELVCLTSRIERAFLPSLGLSNKSAADEDLAQDSDLNSNALPLERELGVSTLWPETRKLYGHDTELVCLTSVPVANTGEDKEEDGEEEKEEVLVASAAKSRDVNNSDIRLWSFGRSQGSGQKACVGILKVRQLMK